MPNRAQRRAMAREQTGKHKALMAQYSRQQRIGALYKNGITQADLDKAYEQGRQEGFRQASFPIIRSCYAGICLALHEKYGFGEKRCYEALVRVDEKVQMTLCDQELADEVLEKTGLIIDFNEPFERVQRRAES